MKPTILSLRLFVCLLTFLPFVLFLPQSSAIELGEELKITDEFEEIEFARNTQGSIEVAALGTVHLVYTLPGSGNPPNNQLMYQTIENGEPTDPIRIDSNSVNAIHPYMILDHEGTLHVVWHDRRHSTAAGNYFDNVEIYYDKKEPEGSFLDEDIRITNTNADHLGDNGFLPQIIQTQNRLFHILWYDFYQDGNVADAYLRTSNEQGEFLPKEGINEDQITFADQRNGGSIWMTTMAELPNNALYVLWGERKDFSGPFTLQGRNVDSNRQLTEIETVAESGSDFFDPPRMASDQDGNLGLVYTTTQDAVDMIAFQYKPVGLEWSEPLILSSIEMNSTQPDIVFDKNNQVLVVWQRDNGEGMLARVHPEIMQVIDIEPFAEFPAWVITPAIAMNRSDGSIHISWVDQRNMDVKSIYYKTNHSTSVKGWRMHVN